MIDMNKPTKPDGQEKTLMRTIKRFVPLIVLLLAIFAFFVSGVHRQLDFDQIAKQYASLQAFVTANPAISVLVTMLIYITATALSFPAAWLLTVTIALIFGWVTTSLIVLISATIGASILFLIARYALEEFFKQRAGNILNKMAKGFREDAVSYMLFLRMAPIFPFTLVNVVPAILGVPFTTFFWTTFVGIIPGVVAYSYAGEGLRSIVVERAEACASGIAPCGEPLTPGDLVTTQILIAFVLLAIVSLIPVVLKRVRASKSGNND